MEVGRVKAPVTAFLERFKLTVRTRASSKEGIKPVGMVPVILLEAKSKRRSLTNGIDRGARGPVSLLEATLRTTWVPRLFSPIISKRSEGKAPVSKLLERSTEVIVNGEKKRLNRVDGMVPVMVFESKYQ